MNTTPQSPLVNIVHKEGLTELKAYAIIQTFGPLVEEAGEAIRMAQAVTITGEPSDKEIADCTALRKRLKSIRTRTENSRVALKQEALSTCNAIDKSARWIRDKIEPVEEEMEKVEQFAARQEAERKETLRVVRTAALKPFGVDVGLYDLGAMEEEAFKRLVKGLDLERQERLRKEAEAEEARKDQEAKAAEESRKLKEENERLRKERQEAQDKADKLEQDKADLAAAEKKRLADDAKAAKKAAAAPDAQKIRALAEALGMLPIPAVKSAEAQGIVHKSGQMIADIQNFLLTAADQL